MNEIFENAPLRSDDMEARLWDYIDGISEASEKALIEKLVNDNAEWRSRYKELLELHQLVQSSELEEPSMRFTKNVMEEISRLHIAPAAKSYINKRVIWGLGFFFIALVAGFLIYGFAQMGASTGEETRLSKDISKLDFSKFFSNTWVNVFLMINVVLGLFLLDNYLSNKRKEFKKA